MDSIAIILIGFVISAILWLIVWFVSKNAQKKNHLQAELENRKAEIISMIEDAINNRPPSAFPDIAQPGLPTLGKWFMVLVWLPFLATIIFTGLHSQNKNLEPLTTTSVSLMFQADLSKKDPLQTDEQVMASVESTIERRISAHGITGQIIQVQNNDKIFVQLPGVKDINQFIDLIGTVGLLEFKEQQLDASGNVVNDANGNPTWIPATATGSDGTTQALTSKYLKPNAAVTLDNLGKPEVAFEWETEGAKLFGEVTTALLNKPLGIFLDNTLISVQTVQAVITDKGVITGLTLDQAKILVAQLNSGQLDVPLEIINSTTTALSPGTIITQSTGTGTAKSGDKVKVDYTLTLADHSVVDTSVGKAPFEFTLGQNQVIVGFEKAVLGMIVGETKTVTIPAAQAYGATPSASNPLAGKDLTFIITLLEIEK